MATLAQTVDHAEYNRLSPEDANQYGYSMTGDNFVLLTRPSSEVDTGSISVDELQPELPGIEATLAERGNRYGVFASVAEIAENIQEAMKNSPNWQLLPPDMKFAFRMIADKSARILNGDMDYDDNWRDISGYATLILNRIIEDQAAKKDK